MPEPQVLRFYAGRGDPDLDGVNATLSNMTWHEEQILGFEAVARGNAVTEIVLTYEFARGFRFLDSAPAQGITLGDGTGEKPPSKVYLQASKRIDPSSVGITGAFLYNGTEIPPSDVVLESDGYTVEIDISSQTYDTAGTKTISATPNVLDINGEELEEGFDLTWHVENFTNIQTGLRIPLAARGRQGRLRVARVAVDHGTDVDNMVRQWQESLALTDKDILRKVHVPGQRLDTRVFVLYFSERQPNIVRTFPTSGSVMAQDTVPARLSFTTDLPMHPDVANDSGILEIDGVGVDSTPVTLSSDGRTLEVDLASYSSAGHHTVRVLGLKGLPDLPTAGPIISSYTVSSLIPSTGGGGVTDHGALTGREDDDHTQYHNDTRGDLRYYTISALDAGQLDNRYYTETELDNGALDGRYFRENEHVDVSSGVPDGSKPVILDSQGKLSDTMMPTTVATLDGSGVVEQPVKYMDAGLLANRPPSPGVDGTVYLATDTNEFFIWMA
jgi:hypothetical protein